MRRTARHSWLITESKLEQTIHVCVRCGMRKITTFRHNGRPLLAYISTDQRGFSVAPPCPGSALGATMDTAA